jgi:hypothetical protein
MGTVNFRSGPRIESNRPTLPTYFNHAWQGLQAPEIAFFHPAGCFGPENCKFEAVGVSRSAWTVLRQFSVHYWNKTIKRLHYSTGGRRITRCALELD